MKTLWRIHWSLSFPTWVKGFSCCSKQSQSKTIICNQRRKTRPAESSTAPSPRDRRHRLSRRDLAGKIDGEHFPRLSARRPTSNSRRVTYIRCRLKKKRNAASHGQRITRWIAWETRLLGDEKLSHFVRTLILNWISIRDRGRIKCARVIWRMLQCGGANTLRVCMRGNANE